MATYGGLLSDVQSDDAKISNPDQEDSEEDSEPELPYIVTLAIALAVGILSAFIVHWLT